MPKFSGKTAKANFGELFSAEDNPRQRIIETSPTYFMLERKANIIISDYWREWVMKHGAKQLDLNFCKTHYTIIVFTFIVANNNDSDRSTDNAFNCYGMP